MLLDGVLAHCDGVVKLLKSDIIQVGSMDFVYNIYKYAGESGWKAKNVAEISYARFFSAFMLQMSCTTINFMEIMLIKR